MHGWGRKGELTLKFPRREQNIGPYIQVTVEGGGGLNQGEFGNVTRLHQYEVIDLLILGDLS